MELVVARNSNDRGARTQRTESLVEESTVCRRNKTDRLETPKIKKKPFKRSSIFLLHWSISIEETIKTQVYWSTVNITRLRLLLGFVLSESAFSSQIQSHSIDPVLSFSSRIGWEDLTNLPTIFLLWKVITKVPHILHQWWPSKLPTRTKARSHWQLRRKSLTVLASEYWWR